MNGLLMMLAVQLSPLLGSFINSINYEGTALDRLNQ